MEMSIQRTALESAIFAEHMERVQALLELGAEVNAPEVR